MSVNLLELQSMVSKFLETTKGKEVMRAQGVSLSCSEADALAAGEILRQRLKAAFISAQKNSKRFNDSKVKVSVSKKSNKDQFVIRVYYPRQTLARPSFMSQESNTIGFTGKGIEDIFALFTNGYNTTKKVYGFWWDDEAQGERDEFGLMSNPLHYPAHDFITRTITQFESEYPNITVTYPNEWKSNT